jgi:multicomponent Na+:H+ antiporter subunit G
VPAHVLAGLCIGIGLFFVLVAAVGFVRLPDVFCRLHVTGVLDTLGAPFVLLGTAIYIGYDLVSLKLALAIVFIAATSPLLAHLLARAALEAGHKPGMIESPQEAARGAARPKPRPDA